MACMFKKNSRNEDNSFKKLKNDTKSFQSFGRDETGEVDVRGNLAIDFSGLYLLY